MWCGVLSGVAPEGRAGRRWGVLRSGSVAGKVLVGGDDDDRQLSRRSVLLDMRTTMGLYWVRRGAGKSSRAWGWMRYMRRRGGAIGS